MLKKGIGISIMLLLLSSGIAISSESFDVTVRPVTTGEQIVRLSLNLPQDLLITGQTMAAYGGRETIPLDLYVLTWHKAEKNTTSVNNAWATFLYTFKNLKPVKFSLKPVSDPKKSVRMDGGGADDVRFETPDTYYGFGSSSNNAEQNNKKSSFDRQFDCPPHPINGKKFRPDYKLNPGGLEITNGPNLFNRPIYAPGCKAFLTAGDWPAFVLWTNNHYKKEGQNGWGSPDGFGYFYPGLSDGAASKYFKDFDTCRTVYHPGWIEYNLSDKAFDGVNAMIEVVPSENGAMIFNICLSLTDQAIKSNYGNKLEIVWTHGSLKNNTMNCWQGSYDIQSTNFPWDQPDMADNDKLEFSNQIAIIRDTKDMNNWVSVGCNPAPSSLFAADASVRLQLTPDLIFDHPANGKPVAAGRVRPALTADNTLEAQIVLKWDRKTNPEDVMKPMVADPKKYLESGKRYFAARTDRLWVKTPDPEFDTVFKFNTCALDSMWHKPGISHGPYSWGGLTTIFRVYYGTTCAGDHDRITSAFNYHCIPSDKGYLSNVSPSVEDKPSWSCYESYGSTTDMLWHHYLWSGDKETLRQWLPMLDGMIKYKEKNRRDSQGLFKDYLGFWCSDSSNYEEGCAVGSTYVWRMYTVRAMMAKVFGEDPKPFEKRAAEIKDALYKYLWSEKEGFFYDAMMADGEKLPSPIAPAIYHPIEYRMVSNEDGNRMFDWMVNRLTSAAGVVRVDDWYPISWSHNVYSPLETANASIAAYRLRRADIGFKMLKSVANGAIHGAVAPGSISCVASSGGYTTNGTDFGDGVSLFMRSTVEGLFGIEMNVPEEMVNLTPNFPKTWSQAEMSIPDVNVYRYTDKRNGGSSVANFELQFKKALKVMASIPLAGTAKSVYVNGSPVKFTSSRYRDGAFVSFETPKLKTFVIDIAYKANGKNAIIPDRDLEALKSDFQLMPAGIAPKTAVSLDKLNYEQIPLLNYETLPFKDIYKLFPGEQTWGMTEQKTNKDMGCVWSSRFGSDNGISMKSRMGVPFMFDREKVVAVKNLHENLLWKGLATDANVPQTLTINVNKPCTVLFLMASGFSTPMTCYLPQVQIDLNYADGSTRQYRLSTPYEFDFITQHTSIHPAEVIGTFVDKPIAPTFSQQLHADVLRLKGKDGLLKSITVTALKRQSGIVIYGLTVANEGS